MIYKSQNAALIVYLTNHNYITSFVAYEELKITELSKRICELISQGYEIEKDWIEGKNSYGNATRFRTYRMK